MHDFKVKFRLNGRVAFVRVTARDAAHARALVLANYGNAVQSYR